MKSSVHSKQALSRRPLALALAMLAFLFSAGVLMALDPQSVGKGMTTKSEMVKRKPSGQIESIEYIEETHLDVRRRVVETHVANDEGYLTPTRRVTSLTDRHWGSITITETAPKGGGALMVSQIDANLKNQRGETSVTTQKLDGNNQLRMESETVVKVDENGDKRIIVRQANKQGLLVEVSNTIIREGDEVSLERILRVPTP